MDKRKEQEVKDTVGRIIKQIRKSKNWSKTKMGKICKVGYGTISGWENGVNLPPAGFMVELAEILADGTPNDLYGITNKTTRTDVMNTKIDLQDLLQYNDQLTFDGLSIPEAIRMGLLQNIKNILGMLGFSK
jgi:transcriptional regulator with XRE-family HTH domain